MPQTTPRQERFLDLAKQVMAWMWPPVALALVAIVAFAAVLWYRGPQEPKYKGRTLSSWLNQWRLSYYNPTDPAAAAIQAIGTNGLPFLLARVSEQICPAERKFSRVTRKFIPEALDPGMRHVWRTLNAAHAINLLGTNGQSAFAVLTNLMAQRSNLAAAIALAGIGHQGVTYLLRGLTNQNWELRHTAAFALENARSDFDEVVPALLNLAKTSGRKTEDCLVRGAAGSALVDLHRRLDLVVPALSGFLTNSDPQVRAYGATLLGSLGSNAAAAFPVLVKARTDSDPNVRESVESALKEIKGQATDGGG